MITTYNLSKNFAYVLRYYIIADLSKSSEFMIKKISLKKIHEKYHYLNNYIFFVLFSSVFYDLLYLGCKR